MQWFAHRAMAAVIGLALVAGCGDDSRSASTDGGPDGDGGAIDAAPDGAPDGSPPNSQRYTLLSQTGFYSDVAGKVRDPALVEFAPRYALWSDGAVKTRWILLPASTQIDSSNMDNWRFPVGTKFFKQFAFTPEGGGSDVIVETRLIERIAAGDGDDAWWRGSFAWYDDNGNALDDPALVEGFNRDVDLAPWLPNREPTTIYRVPAQAACQFCHNGTSHRVLGFQAVQLTDATPLDIDDWAATKFTVQPTPGGYPVPGGPGERAALGYLHANCSHCHGPPDLRATSMACYDTTGQVTPETIPNLDFRIRTTDTTVEGTATFQNTVGIGMVNPQGNGTDLPTTRIVAGDATNSAVHVRMNQRGSTKQMPPLADGFTLVVDVAGVALIEDWINNDL